MYPSSIAVITDSIKVKDSYFNYQILVTKNRYISKDTTLTNAQLRTYVNYPLLFTLRPETIASVTIGQNYGGGLIAYILQPGDPGYIAGETHGLIVAFSDKSTSAEWGCQGIIITDVNDTI